MTFSIALTFMVTRQSTIILIIKLLFMSILLKLNKVNLKYQTGKDNIRVLKDINLTTKKKETISIVGESGSGKTSLIMLIGGLEKATSGKIFFLNIQPIEISSTEIKNKIFQNKSVSTSVPIEVAKYIEENKLYASSSGQEK